MKKKLLIILSLVVVLSMCMAFVACSSGLSQEQIDNLFKELQKDHSKDAEESSVSFWVLGKVSYLEDGGKEISATVQWTIEGTTLVTVGTVPNANGQYQIIVPEEVDDEVSYKLVGTMVDGSGKAYTDSTGKVCKVEISKKVPAGKGKGTAESPYSVAGALAEFATTAPDTYSAEKTYVRGMVVTVPTYNSTYNSYSFYIADNKEGTRLQIYSSQLGSGVVAPCQNDTVVIHGFYMNYKGNSPELTGDKDHDYPEILSRKAGTSTISAAANANADIVLDKTSGLNGETFTFTVTAKNDAVISSVKVNGEEVQASNGKYTGTIAGDTVVSVVALAKVEGEQTATVNMATGFASYASTWSNSYASKTLDSTDLGITNLNLTLTLSNVSKQTGTITDIPTMAAKGGTMQYATLMVQGTISSVTFNLREWSNVKTFKTLCIEYTTNGSTWTMVEGVGFKDASPEKKVSEGYTELTASSLPTGVVGVRLAFTSEYQYNGSASNQQVGFAGFSVTALPGEGAPEGPGNLLDAFKSEIVKNPAVGTEYTLALCQVNNKEILYATDELNSKGFIVTTTDVTKAATLKLEAATGGYYLKLGNKYITLTGSRDEKGNGKAAVSLTDTATTVFVVGDSDMLIATFNIDKNNVPTDESFVLGTYGTYDTISASSTYYVTGSKAGDIDTSQFVCRILTKNPITA